MTNLSSAPMGANSIPLDRASVPYTGRAVGLPASLLRPGFCLRLKLSSGQFRMHDVTGIEAREVCAAVSAANREREGKRDPQNCMADWEPI